VLVIIYSNQTEYKTMSETLKTLTPEDIAQILHCTVRTVMTYLRTGRIQATQISRRWIVLEDDLRSFLSSYPKADKSLSKRVSALGVCTDIPRLSTEQFMKDKREEVDLEEAKLQRATGAG
jgi:hypothetical protein